MTSSPAISLSSVVAQVSGLLASTVDGEEMLMNVARGHCYGLDAVGTDIWHRLAQPVAVDRLCRALGETYDADPTTIERDVLALLSRLAGEGLISVGGPENGSAA
ncbi:MAG: PqqD family peptide modification chaperone [Rhodospirillaceae bacterium]